MVVYTLSLYYKWIDKNANRINLGIFANKKRVQLDNEPPRAYNFDMDLVGTDSEDMTYKQIIKESRENGSLKEDQIPYFRGFGAPDPDMEKVMDITIKVGVKKGGKVYVKYGDFQRYVFIPGSTSAVNYFQSYIDNYKQNLKRIFTIKFVAEERKEVQDMLTEINNAESEEKKTHLIVKLERYINSTAHENKSK